MQIDERPLTVRLHGMDSRTVKTMMMFFSGPCNGVARVVDTEDADVDIFDGDAPNSKKLMTEHLITALTRPVIVLSLTEIINQGVVHVKKPIKTMDMIDALSRAKASLKSKPPIDELEIVQPSLLHTDVISSQQQIDELENTGKPISIINTNEREKTAKHTTAMRLDEKSYNTYIGLLPDIEVNEPKKLNSAFYNPKDFYQGYVQSAIAVCQSKNKILMLKSDWHSISLFPRTNEVWLDADDLELKAFAGIQLCHKTMTTEMPLIGVDPNKMNLSGNLEKFQNMDSFLWKLACWTSRGRYPYDINLEYPVFLKNWPNFTRVLITPHALRIAALLIKGPRTMINIAQVLNIKPEYVFIFISAAHAVGLAGQAKRTADNLLQVQDVMPSKSQGLLGRIMSKLRGN